MRGVVLLTVTPPDCCAGYSQLGSGKNWFVTGKEKLLRIFKQVSSDKFSDHNSGHGFTSSLTFVGVPIAKYHLHVIRHFFSDHVCACTFGNIGKIR